MKRLAILTFSLGVMVAPFQAHAQKAVEFNGMVLDSDKLVNAKDNDANMIAPANANPNDRPKDPAAEFTPAASLTRSSEIGASV